MYSQLVLFNQRLLTMLPHSLHPLRSPRRLHPLLLLLTSTLHLLLAAPLVPAPLRPVPLPWCLFILYQLIPCWAALQILSTLCSSAVMGWSG